VRVEPLDCDGLDPRPRVERLEDLVARPDPAARPELDDGAVEDGVKAAGDRGLVATRQGQLERLQGLGFGLRRRGLHLGHC
jgi:hypothetical protein